MDSKCGIFFEHFTYHHFLVICLLISNIQQDQPIQGFPWKKISIYLFSNEIDHYVDYKIIFDLTME